MKHQGTRTSSIYFFQTRKWHQIIYVIDVLRGLKAELGVRKMMLKEEMEDRIIFRISLFNRLIG